MHAIKVLQHRTPVRLNGRPQCYVGNLQIHGLIPIRLLVHDTKEIRIRYRDTLKIPMFAYDL